VSHVFSPASAAIARKRNLSIKTGGSWKSRPAECPRMKPSSGGANNKRKAESSGRLRAGSRSSRNTWRTWMLPTSISCSIFLRKRRRSLGSL